MRRRYGEFKTYMNNTLTPLWCKYCPQGIPSGKNQEDMLKEVRKEAYSLRKTTSKADEDDDEEEQLDVSQPLTLSEEWTKWYPTEWIGWCMYGVSSQQPTEYWVNQPESNGPTDVEHYYTDDMGKRKSKKTPDRVTQRDREGAVTTYTKITTNDQTVMTHRVLQVDTELRIATMTSDYQLIKLMIENANNEEEREFGAWALGAFLQGNRNLLRARLVKGIEVNASLERPPPPPAPVLPPPPPVDVVDTYTPVLYEDEDTFEGTPMERYAYDSLGSNSGPFRGSFSQDFEEGSQSYHVQDVPQAESYAGQNRDRARDRESLSYSEDNSFMNSPAEFHLTEFAGPSTSRSTIKFATTDISMLFAIDRNEPSLTRPPLVPKVMISTSKVTKVSKVKSVTSIPYASTQQGILQLKMRLIPTLEMILST